MKSPNICSRANGFTFIELVIVIAIIGFLAAAGIMVGLDAYGRYVFRSDLDAVTSLLEKARSEAINNIGESAHGVYLADPDYLILFAGSSYSGDPELKIPKSPSVSYSAPAAVVFTPLSGQTLDANIVLTQNSKTNTVNINHEGGINW